MTFTIIIVSAVFIILLILPQIIKRVVYKKLTTYLGNRQYEEFEKLLDGFFATFSFKPFNREYMRLTACFMQNDKKKIEAQLDNIFSRIKMKDAQKAAVANRGFYFYLENKNYKKAEKMLKLCQKTDENANDVHVMEMMYNIMALHKSENLQEIKDRLEPLKKESDAYTNQAKRVRIGIFEYLLGLQYSYQNNKKTSQSYLKSALQNCKNTPYEREIKQLLEA